MSKEFSYTINKDSTATIRVNAKKLNTIKLTTLITQIQAIYRELENYQQVPRKGPKAPPKKPRKARKMPKGTKVESVYTGILRSGKDKATAAKIAQSKTGQSLKTGKPPKKK